MAKRMLVDATHPEEIRVAIVDDEAGLLDLDMEASSREQIKGNIYLGKVTRVEPSLQAAFVDYGGERQGFLPINDIHAKYYPDNTPKEDLPPPPPEENGEVLPEEKPAPSRPARRHLPIQKILHRNQPLLVQVAKESRGTKGASLTTFLSLPGRYTVFMPENNQGGGVSRKIEDSEDRQRLREVMQSLEVHGEGSLIIRTAGIDRTKLEIKRDFNYLLRLWKEIREKADTSKAPTLLYEEGDLIIRTIRDIFSSDMEEILVEGAEGYRRAKDFMRLLLPRHVKVVQPFRGRQPIFSHYKVESQIESMHERTIPLRSGAYIVVDHTEALVSIDINSGRATREKDIETTAYKINIEAADEIARQLRLRDLGGLIIIDFIDMEDKKHVLAVERHMKEALHFDRARIRLGRISQFGMLELSRQRLKPAFSESSRIPCPRCQGMGAIRSLESASIQVFRTIETEATAGKYAELHFYTPLEVANYLLNHKRSQLGKLEEENGLVILINVDPAMQTPDYRFEYVPLPKGEVAAQTEKVVVAKELPVLDEEERAEEGDDEEEEEGAGETVGEGGEAAQTPARRRRRRRRRRRGGAVAAVAGEATATDGDAEPDAELEESSIVQEAPGLFRIHEPEVVVVDEEPVAAPAVDGEPVAAPAVDGETPVVAPVRRRRRRRKPAGAAPRPLEEEGGEGGGGEVGAGEAADLPELPFEPDE